MKAVISGGTKGIGRAILELFLEKGIDVATCARSQEGLSDLNEAVEAKYPDREVITFQADVSKKDEVVAFGELIKSKWDRIDILVNNAGIFLPGEITKEEDGTLESQIETNLYSAYYLTRSLLPNMTPHKAGTIVNMCSIASKIAYPNGGSYSISKFALLGFSKVLREELKETGIKVTSILPGATWSASWDGVDLPKERLMQAHDIALATWNAIELSKSAVIEEVVLRPQLGDL